MDPISWILVGIFALIAIAAGFAFMSLRSAVAREKTLADERVKTAELLNRIIKDRSVLVIEHDMKFVEDIAHKVTVLHQGQILSEGTMDKVKNDPKVIEVYLGH